MLYCENCRRLYKEDQVCPECRKAKGRAPKEDDACFVFSGGQIWTDMLCEVFSQNDIPFIRQGRLGAGMAMLTGLSNETYEVYTPYARYEEAAEITEAFLNAPEAEEEYPESETEMEEEEEEE